MRILLHYGLIEAIALLWQTLSDYKISDANCRTSNQMNTKIYRSAVLFPRLLTKAIAKPKYIVLCLWAFKRLWWVDSRLKPMALAALKIPADSKPNPLSPEQRKKIRQRAIAIAWTAKIHPLRPMCLHRSLVLHQWLKEEGINAQLEIGWGENIGHAWVTYGDRVLNDRADIARLTPRLTKV